MFIDSAQIYVRSGKGGDGAVSFYRGKYIPKGGPNGGNGGDGGSVILVSDPNVETLLDFAGRHHWRAEDGEAGRGKQQYGRKGEDLEILLPPGTQVFDHDTGELIIDLEEAGHRLVIAKGGRGGFGNEHFKSPTLQSPMHASPGEPSIELNLRFELKLVADIGLVGKPNAGKSTLLSSVSKARPRIADYPFTTLIPQPGVAELGEGRRLVICDIPGLIEHASQGAGLGHRFLRHIERTRLIVHLIEIEPTDNSDPARNYRTIRKELEAYSPTLGEKPEVVALSKADLLGDEQDVQTAVQLVKDELGIELFVISSATGRGLTDLLERCWSLVRGADADADAAPPWDAR